MTKAPKTPSLFPACLAWVLVLAALIVPAARPAPAADGLFAPALYVNGRAITGFELQQRRAFLELIRTPGDLDKAARDAMIDDKLRLAAAEQLEITLTDEQLQRGMTEFAGRANLTLEQFTAELAKGGVEQESFRDFVYAGLVWREVVRARFSPQVTVTAEDVTYAMDMAVQKGEVRLLLSELVVPYAPEKKAEAEAFVRELRDGIGNADDFAAAAKQYSASPTGPQGGVLEWMPLSNLPPSLGPLLLQIGAGHVSDVVNVPGALVLFFVRGVSDDPVRLVREQELDYAQFLVPATDTAMLAKLRAKSDDCDDLYTLAKGLPADRLLRDKKPAGQVPRDIALELAKLDPGDSSTALVRGGWRVFLMLCSRAPLEGEDSPTRESVAAELRNTKLTLYAENYLRDLRARAIIREP